MSRILAIDYGKKRTGVAVTDVLQIIANGLTTVPTHQLLDFYSENMWKKSLWNASLWGHPKQMNNQESENMRNIVLFVNQLRKIPDIPVEFVDERFTSLYWPTKPCWMEA